MRKYVISLLEWKDHPMKYNTLMHILKEKGAPVVGKTWLSYDKKYTKHQVYNRRLKQWEFTFLYGGAGMIIEEFYE